MPADKPLEQGVFIFGDLHVKDLGHFRLKFTLYEVRSRSACPSHRDDTLLIDVLAVLNQLTWPCSVLFSLNHSGVSAGMPVPDLANISSPFGQDVAWPD